MPQTQTSIDWTSVINNTIAQVPSWLAIAQHQPVPLAVPAGTQGGSLAVSSQGIAGSVSPGVLIVGAIVIIGAILLLKK